MMSQDSNDRLAPTTRGYYILAICVTTRHFIRCKKGYDEAHSGSIASCVCLSAQGSNFWNLYTVGIGDDDPYQVTLDDASTTGIIDAHVSPLALAAACAKTHGNTVQGQRQGQCAMKSSS